MRYFTPGVKVEFTVCVAALAALSAEEVLLIVEGSTSRITITSMFILSLICTFDNCTLDSGALLVDLLLPYAILSSSGEPTDNFPFTVVSSPETGSEPDFLQD